MTNSDLDSKLETNRRERIKQVKRWAEYVRDNPDEDWGRQVNEVVDSQIQSARHFHAEDSSDE